MSFRLSAGGGQRGPRLIHGGQELGRGEAGIGPTNPQEILERLAVSAHLSEEAFVFGEGVRFSPALLSVSPAANWGDLVGTKGRCCGAG